MQALLRGISPRSEITHKNWTSAMGERLRRTALGQIPPFHCSRGTEAVTYASLPTSDRYLQVPMQSFPSHAPSLPAPTLRTARQRLTQRCRVHRYAAEPRFSGFRMYTCIWLAREVSAAEYGL